tara:strand:+ start:760 stop:1296 length:537 start_codon:yes stop_codon:yes gene_type:complete
MDKLSYKFFRDLNITPNNYVFLYNVIVLKNTSITPLIHELSKLEDAGFLKIIPKDVSYNFEYVLKDKAYGLFVEDNIEQKWLEFKKCFPIKSGVRRLHDNPEGCKKKYINLLETGVSHKDILLGLDNECLARQEASSKHLFMSDWKLMSTWLNQKNWLVYLDYEVEIKEKPANYGEDI